MKNLHGIGGLGQRKPRINRDWSEANVKRDDEQVCRSCGSGYRVELAHVIGCEMDSEPPLRPSSRWRPYVVAPDRVIPLCNDCHQGPNGQHANRLDVLSLLEPIEIAQAVMDAGGLYQALYALVPGENPRRVAR